MIRATLIIALASIAAGWGASSAGAFQVAVQDQGASVDVLHDLATQLGTRTVRIVARPGQPNAELVRDYHQRGLRVQAAILVKRDTTPGDVRAVIRAWHGQVRTISIGNEPELNGVPACTYARLFARASALIRREFPGTRIGFGEYSPLGFEQPAKTARCHVRIRADFTGVHCYQFNSDPLAPPTERTGYGRWLGLGSLGAFKRELRRAHLPSRLRCTEFAYLVSGPYRISMARASSLWPRAVRQARRHVEQLVVYGAGVVHDQSRWGSASLLDAFGRSTPALQALARALGRTYRDTQPPPAPAGDLITALPDGAPMRAQPLPVPVPDVAAGAATDPPAPVLEPDAPADPPAPDPEPEPAPADPPALEAAP